MILLWILVSVLIVFWLIGVAFKIVGVAIHLVLVIALALLASHFISSRTRRLFHRTAEIPTDKPTRRL